MTFHPYYTYTKGGLPKSSAFGLLVGTFLQKYLHRNFFTIIFVKVLTNKRNMEIIRAGNFVLGCSKETKDEIEDAVIRKLKEELTVPILYGSRENREGNGILSQLRDLEKTRKKDH